MNIMATQVSLGLHKHFLLICDVSKETRKLADLMKYMLWNKASVFYFFPVRSQDTLKQTQRWFDKLFLFPI